MDFSNIAIDFSPFFKIQVVHLMKIQFVEAMM